MEQVMAGIEIDFSSHDYEKLVILCFAPQIQDTAMHPHVSGRIHFNLAENLLQIGEESRSVEKRKISNRRRM